MPVTASDVHAAQARLANHAIVTPLLESPFINELAGRRVLIKAECLQRTGAFKFRGAWSALTALDDTERARGVIAFSSGNHAQAVAHAAAILECAATIVMPADAPALKIQNTRDYGAEVILYDRAGGEDRELIGEQLSRERGLSLIKPYDHPQVIAGQGTCGLEIAAQTAALGVNKAEVLVCCGGGGLTSGIALALEDSPGDLIARPVEPESGDDVCRSLVSGQREQNATAPDTICDAIVTPSPGELTFPIMKRLCGSGLTVTDEQVLVAIKTAMQRLKIVAEPGGAVALAAALHHQNQINGDTVVVVVSGGNADPATITRALAS